MVNISVGDERGVHAKDVIHDRRPSLPDFLPAIGRLERAPNVLYAFGHAHLGLTEAPIASEVVCALATDKAPAFDLAPFRVERFG